MTYTEEQLTLLEAALAKGEKRITFGDKTIEYRSVEELKEAIRAVERGLAEQAAHTGLIPPPARQIRVVTGKGF